jgi:hypothetical protein
MKKLLSVSIFVFLGFAIYAQKNFEGTITYKSTITGDNAEMMSGMMPNSYSLKFLGSDCRSEMTGGMAGSMFGPFICMGQTAETFMIKDQEKTVYKMDPQQSKTGDEKPHVVTDMNKSLRIAGYNCKQYRVEQEQRGTKMFIDIWTTKELRLSDMTSNPAIESIFYKGVDGVPLMVEMSMNIQGSDVIINIKANSVKAEILASSLFEIPPAYLVKPFKSPMGR